MGYARITARWKDAEQGKEGACAQRTVECRIGEGLPGFRIMGDFDRGAAGDMAARISAAIEGSGYAMPRSSVTVNIVAGAEAGAAQPGEVLESAIAQAVLSATGQISDITGTSVETARMDLDGRVHLDPGATLREICGQAVDARAAEAQLPLNRAVAARALELMDEAATIRESMADTDPEALMRKGDADIADLALRACELLHRPLAETLRRAEGIDLAVEAKQRARAVALLDALADESRNFSDTGMVFVEEAWDLGSLGDGFNEMDLQCLERFLESPEGACYAGAVEAESSPVPGDPVITCYGALPDVHEAAKEAAVRAMEADPDPAYYHDVASEAIGNPEAPRGKSVTPKGDTMLAAFGEDALIFRGPQAVQPYVVARGYNPERGDWAAGTYYDSPVEAWCDANPEIIAGSALYWERGDIAEALEGRGLPANDYNIDAVIAEADGMMPVKLRAYETGSDFIRECIDDCTHMLDKEAPGAFSVVQDGPSELSEDLGRAAEAAGHAKAPGPAKQGAARDGGVRLLRTDARGARI